MEMGKIIREHRIKKGLTMKELGDIVGVTEQAISQYELEKRKPDIKILLRIFGAIDYEITPHKNIAGDQIYDETIEYICKLSSYLSRLNILNEEDFYITQIELQDIIDMNRSYLIKMIESHKKSNIVNPDMAYKVFKKKDKEYIK